jgi:hypothetical protein
MEDTKSDFPELPRATDSSEINASPVLPAIDYPPEEESSSREIPILPAAMRNVKIRLPPWLIFVFLGLCTVLLLIWLL